MTTAMPIQIFLIVVAALGLAGALWLITAPFRLLPRQLRGIAFGLVLLACLWGFAQRAPVAAIPAPAAVPAAVVSPPTLFLPFVGR